MQELEYQMRDGGASIFVAEDQEYLDKVMPLLDRLPALRHIVIIDPDTPQAYHWSRLADGSWGHELLEGLEAAIALPEIPCALDLATLYAGLTFQPRPRLVQE